MWWAPTKPCCLAEIVAATAIICLGNRFVPGDELGCRVFDRLTNAELPPDIEVVDGGVCGLDLLWQVEGRQRVVFVDALAEVAAAGEIVALRREQVAEYARAYGHGAGLPYLLHMLPKVCEAPLPDVVLLGTGGEVDDAVIRTLAERSMEVAIHGIS